MQQSTEDGIVVDLTMSLILICYDKTMPMTDDTTERESEEEDTEDDGRLN